MPEDHADCKPYQIVFLAEGVEGFENIFPYTYPDNLDDFCDDMHALGFALWPTPTHIYVFVGATE